MRKSQKSGKIGCMGAGARRRSARRRQEDAAEAADAARFWEELAGSWSASRAPEDQVDAEWALKIARAAGRQATLLETGPASLVYLRRLVRVRGEVDRAIAALVGRLRDRGERWESIADALGVSRQAATKRYGGGGGLR